MEHNNSPESVGEQDQELPPNFIDGQRVYPHDEPRRAPFAIIQQAGNPAKVILDVDHIYIDVTHATQDEVKEVWPTIAQHQAVLKKAGLSRKRSGPEGTRDEEARRWIEHCRWIAYRAGHTSPSPDDIKEARDAFKQECKEEGFDYTQSYIDFWYPYVQRFFKRKIKSVASAPNK